MSLLEKICDKLTRHRFRREMACEVHIGSYTRYYLCWCCGKLIREEANRHDQRTSSGNS